MHSRRRNNTASGTAFVNTRNRRQVSSMPEDAPEDNGKDVVAAGTAYKRVDGDKQNPFPGQTHSENRSRSSNEENNNPNSGEICTVQAAVGHRPGGEMNGRGHARPPVLQEDSFNNLDLGGGDNLLEQYSQLNVNRDRESTIYFVIADSLTEATCSSRLTMAFQVNQSHGTWLHPFLWF